VPLAKSLAIAWAPDGINVNVVLPGATNTPFTKVTLVLVCFAADSSTVALHICTHTPFTKARLAQHGITGSQVDCSC
jgi:NAD(P)-dependent dehydrogenase (short-subunit alcohol dehydrogenase family)